MSRPATRTCVVVWGLIAVLCGAEAARASGPWSAAEMDWPFWRGPEMNGVSREKGIVEKWDPAGGEGSNLLWKREDLGTRTTPIAMNGKLYVILRDQPETPTEAERVVCLDAATGETQWENRFNIYLSDVPDTRVGWSCLCGDPETGDVFALGVCGFFQCLDGKTGKTKWSHSLSEEYGLLSTYGGRTNNPIVVGNLVIISAVMTGWGDYARPSHLFVAFDKRNGQAVWLSGTRPLPDDTTYSTPVVAVIDGQAQLVFGSGDGGVHAFQPQTGKKIWNYMGSLRGINTTPLVLGKTIVCGHSEENLDTNQMGAMFALEADKTGDITKTGQIWRNTQMLVGRSSPLHWDGRIYVVQDTGTLNVLDARTGEQVATEKLRGTGRPSPLYADGKIFIVTESGIWWTFKPTKEGLETVHRARLDVGEVLGSPIVSRGRLYVPTTNGLYCAGNTAVKPSTDPRPAMPAETPVDKDLKPAQIQVVPAESLLKPGQRQQFQVRLYNANGQFVGLAEDVEYAVEGAGAIDAKGGKYTAPKEAAHAAVVVKAKFGDLVGQARIRVVPDLDWSFDFQDGAVPITWIGARYRHVVVEHELFKKLEKQDPLAARLYVYFVTGFTNSGRPMLKYDDSTPAQGWTSLLRYAELVGTVVDLAGAKAKLDPALKILLDEQVIAKAEWGAADPVQLTVAKGPRKMEGNLVMCKITTIPKGTRSQSWMGHVDLHDFTIQADLQASDRVASGGAPNGKLPDMGIVGQRYTLDMMGASQQLQIRTWPPQLRMAKSVPFAWKPHVWYTLKLRTAVEDGKAVLRGKAWPRDGQEPAEWMIVAEDASPNLTGSPGLYGSAKDSEIFIDNVKVTANAKPSAAPKPPADPKAPANPKP